MSSIQAYHVDGSESNFPLWFQMYRIGCLRDDVIFFIFLYQRYIYRIDPTRLNEFGYSAEMLEEKAKEKEQKAAGQPAIESSNGKPKSVKEKKKQ